MKIKAEGLVQPVAGKQRFEIEVVPKVIGGRVGGVPGNRTIVATDQLIGKLHVADCLERSEKLGVRIHSDF